jgi:hypothetical protein
MPCSNETDILVSQQIKDKIWDFEYTDFTQLIRQNGQYYNNIEQKQNISLENGKLVISNMSSELNQLTILIYGQNLSPIFQKILIQKHPLLASDLLTYMSIIRGAVADTPFERIYQYDRQFRLRVAQNHTKSWAQIDGFLWLQFIAKGAQGVSNAVHDNLTKPCFDYNFK